MDSQKPDSTRDKLRHVLEEAERSQEVMRKVHEVKQSLLVNRFPEPAMAASILDAQKQLQESMLIRQEIVSEVIERNRKDFERIQAAISKIIEVQQKYIKTAFEGINRYIEALQEDLKNAGLDAQAIGPYFEEADLWLSPSMSTFIWYEIRNLYRMGELATPKLKELVTNKFNYNNFELLRNMVEGWQTQTEFQIRQRFLKDALEAHVMGKFTLSVPVLLAMAEGIMLHIMGKERSRHKELIAEIKKLSFQTDFKAVHEDQFNIALDYLFSDSSKIPDGKLNRHVILHGTNLNYDTELNSLRLFLVLDQLHMYCEFRSYTS